MFQQQQIPSDSQLSIDQMANMLVADAVAQLQQLSNYSKATCESIIAQQFQDNLPKQPRNNINVLDQQEVGFIAELFI